MTREQEMAWESFLPKNSYVALRVDGKNFTNFTKKMRVNGPFNDDFTDRMLNVGRVLADNVTSAVALYVQSDEVSVIFHDLTSPNAEKWMGGRVQKLASLSAGYASAAFNQGTNDLAVFDGRVFDLTDNREVVIDYLWERYLSGVKNSVSMYAYSKFHPGDLMGLTTAMRKEMLRNNGYDWDKDVSERHKYGTLFYKKNILKESTFTLNGITQTVKVQRNVWVEKTLDDSPDFTKYL